MNIYRSAVRMNITVREDCVLSEPAISFLFPLGKILQLFQDTRHKTQKNAIVTGVASNTFFEKIPEGGVTFWGQKSDSHRWGNVIFFGLFWGKQQRNRGAFGK